MRHGFFSQHFRSSPEAGVSIVSGGCTSGRGFTISWQNGPLGKGNERKEPNGAFVEDVIDACRDRLIAFQESAFVCEENAEAVRYLGLALAALDKRTQRRQDAGTEGTHAETPR